MPAYYNEIEPFAARWLENLIAAGFIPPGDVDTRSIHEVRPEDLAGYVQCHFFAGLGGWAYACRLAGWPDDRPIWTGSPPCQPFSVAGRGAGHADERHLWPELFRLVRSKRPPVLMGEQVAAAVGKHWLDGVFSDLEGIGYACGAAVVPACAVNAPHRRDRLWFVAGAHGLRAPEAVAYASGTGLPPSERAGGGQPCKPATDQREATAQRSGGGALAYADQPCAGSKRAERSGELGGAGGYSRSCSGGAVGHPEKLRPPAGPCVAGADIGAGEPERSGSWSGAGWLVGADGKARRVEPGIRLLAHGIPARVGKLRAYGNAIVPQVAAEVIGAYLDAEAGGTSPEPEVQP